MLGLPVSVLMTSIGRPPRDADGEEGQERGYEVGSGMDRLGDEPEAAARQSGHELDDDQDAGGENRDESGTPLGSHT